ncbi:MAG TPA: imidazolonepropionase, partial [Agromyces sp.]|nr:imidazolonepropionase [Agromyces sp.]
MAPAAAARLLVTGIGELVTNDPAPDREGGALGIVRDAAVLAEDGRITWIGPSAEAPDVEPSGAVPHPHRIEVVHAGGRAVIPGFVDSHTHLVFGGDRAEEFAARMAGRRYEAGGIRSTVAATRAATDDELRARLVGFV